MTTVTHPAAWLTGIFDSLASGDPDGFVQVFADDAVYEFPFASEGRPARLDGKASIATFMRQFAGGAIRFGTVNDIRLREAGDELIIEATDHHHRGDGTAFESRYVWFITFTDGLVTHFRDYINPLPFANH